MLGPFSRRWPPLPLIFLEEAQRHVVLARPQPSTDIPAAWAARKIYGATIINPLVRTRVASNDW